LLLVSAVFLFFIAVIATFLARFGQQRSGKNQYTFSYHQIEGITAPEKKWLVPFTLFHSFPGKSPSHRGPSISIHRGGQCPAESFGGVAAYGGVVASPGRLWGPAHGFSCASHGDADLPGLGGIINPCSGYPLAN